LPDITAAQVCANPFASGVTAPTPVTTALLIAVYLIMVNLGIEAVYDNPGEKMTPPQGVLAGLFLVPA
jgi:hypothetical protein